MAMVCGLDLHRRQITFDALEANSGQECWAGSGSPTGSGSAAGFAAT